MKSDIMHITCVFIYASKVKLTESPYEGYIKVYDGSIWRFVGENNWDKNRQKMFCEYLGFNDMDASIRGAILNKRNNTATGDFICYKTQSEEVSCCVHLKPTNQERTWIPYARCKVCDKPMLSSAIFSGSGSTNYNTASITSSGWCASGSAPYLLIDLRKEYHITRVVVMGNKDQTKWSESYLLRYSHDRTLVHHSTSIKINGNQNGYLYRASTTEVNIHNARYLKINSIENREFCLRIQLCGEAQTPAPVHDVRITRSGTHWASVWWNLPTATTSSYVTQIQISVDQLADVPAHVHELSITRSEARWASVSWKLPTALPSSHVTQLEISVYRNGYLLRSVVISRRTQFNITGLDPNTEYRVGIRTIDVSRLSTKVIYERFKTKEAALGASPTNVRFTFRSKTELRISWNKPNTQACNCEVTGYKICYSTQESAEKCEELPTIKTQGTVTSLKSSTKYFVTVSAKTRVGYGPKSKEISKITNGGRVNPVPISYSSLLIPNINPPTYIREVMVIVQSGSGSRGKVENIRTKDLKPYQANKGGRYIAAYFAINSGSRFTFVIGDGKEHQFKKKKYLNKPLEQNSTYVIFLRYFEKNSYYSTGWSEEIKTLVKPPVDVEPVGSIRTIQSHTAEGIPDTIVTTVTTIVTTTVGAGVFLVILFQVLLIVYKRRKKSTAVNILMETVDTPQEPLRNDQGQVYETVADVHPKFCNNVKPNAVESDRSPKVRKIPYDVCKITGNEDQAKKDTGNLKTIPAEATGCEVLIQEDNPVNLTPSIPKENEQKTPDQDGICDLLALSEEISGQESHHHEPHKMSKAKENLSEYEELDDCRRQVEDPHVYQKLVKA